MAIVRQTLVYDGPGGPFEGVIAYDDEVETARPGVMVGALRPLRDLRSRLCGAVRHCTHSLPH